MLQGTLTAGSIGGLRRFGSVGWLRSPAFDLAFIVGLAGVALGAGAGLSINPALFPVIFFINLWVFGFPHVIATFTRTAFDRPSFIQYRHLNLPLPPLLLVIVVGLGFGIGQWVLATTYLYWQTFHYARQGYGVAQMFARKPENAPNVNQQLSRWVLYAVPLWGILSRSAENPQQFLGLPLRSLPVPPIAVSIAGVLCFALVGMWAVSQFRLLREQRLPLPHTLFVCSHLAIFAVGYVLIDQIDVGWLVVNIWHNMQYLFFVWHFNNKRFAERIDPQRRFISWLSQRGHVVAYAATCLVLSTVVYTAAFQLSHLVALQTMSLAFIIGQTLNYHHYIVDGIIWKRRAQPAAAAPS
jgi:hypothetical protein